MDIYANKNFFKPNTNPDANVNVNVNKLRLIAVSAIARYPSVPDSAN